jgi:hypothetical protein
MMKGYQIYEENLIFFFISAHWPSSALGPSVLCTTEYTELQPLLSGVHSVMRVKLVLAGEGGGARPPPLITFTLTSKVAVYAPAEWADTLTLFHL